MLLVRMQIVHAALLLRGMRADLEAHLAVAHAAMQIGDAFDPQVLKAVPHTLHQIGLESAHAALIYYGARHALCHLDRVGKVLQCMLE